MRLCRIEEEYAGIVEVTWKSFLLRPFPEPRDLEKFRAYTKSWKAPAGQPDGGRFRQWQSDASPPSHSVPANVAVKAAAHQGEFSRYHLALMDAYFYANRNVTERETIIDVAGECDLDIEAFVRVLDDEATVEAVLADHNDAIARGITGVPTVVLNDDFPMPGAQDLDFYRHVIARQILINQEGEEQR